MSLTHRGRREVEPRGWWARRSKKGKLGIILAALMILSAVAVALVSLFAGINGTVDGYDAEIAWGNTDQPGFLPTGQATQCTVTTNNPGVVGNTLTISWPSPKPGDLCFVSKFVTNFATNDESLVIQSLAVPAGITAYQAGQVDLTSIGGPDLEASIIGDRCDSGPAPVPGPTQRTPGDNLRLTYILEFNGDVDPVTWDALTDGVYVVGISAHMEGNCDPVFTP